MTSFITVAPFAARNAVYLGATEGVLKSGPFAWSFLQEKGTPSALFS